MDTHPSERDPAERYALACKTPPNTLPPEVVDKAWAMYEPGALRRYGLCEWPTLPRRLDCIDPSYRD